MNSQRRISFQLTKADTGFAGHWLALSIHLNLAAQGSWAIAIELGVSRRIEPARRSEGDYEQTYQTCRIWTLLWLSFDGWSDDLATRRVDDGSARFDDSQTVSPYALSCFHQLEKSDAKPNGWNWWPSAGVEDGRLFILFNQNSAASPLNNEQRKYLSELTNLQAILSQLERNKGLFSTLAQNILPSWRELYRNACERSSIAEKDTLCLRLLCVVSMCYHVCIAIETYMEVEVNTYSFRELAQLFRVWFKRRLGVV